MKDFYNLEPEYFFKGGFSFYEFSTTEDHKALEEAADTMPKYKSFSILNTYYFIRGEYFAKLSGWVE